MISPGIFRGNDIRAIYPEEIDEESAYMVGLKVCEVLEAEVVYLGRDGRLSSESLRDSFVKGVLDAGYTVVDGGMMDTCQFYYSVHKGGYDCGVMITASHNPADWNGLKIVKKNAQPITDKTELGEVRDACLALKDNVTVAASNADMSGASVSYKSYRSEYLDFVYSKVECPDFTGFKIVMDASSGAGALFVKDFFDRIGSEVIFVNSEIDGTFPNHSPDPTKKECGDLLSEKVLFEKADLGIMLDGDADRVIFCNEKGEVLRGDISLGILAKSYLKNHKNSLVGCDLRSSDYVRDMVETSGGTLIEMPVGHSFIVNEMIGQDVGFAGELSGHMYFSYDGLVADNSWIAILKMMKIMSEEGALSKLMSSSSDYYVVPETNFRDINVEKAILAVEEELSEECVVKCNLDGLSMRFIDWRLNLRKSNTESLVRLMIEGRSKDFVLEKLLMVKKLIESA